ncbi:MAG: ABC transporter substrate-binding protein [Xanthobacteraceae bacterium]|nr:ABC transporter substrate-binding protein [Xanthobacteraceae bacterium]
MKRRDFFGLVGGSLLWPFSTHAQQGAKLPRIGILLPGPSQGPDGSRATLDALVEKLREDGYSEGQQVVIDRRFAESSPERLRELAAELVARQVDVIVAISTTAARPARRATGLIPIVAFGMADPVEDELVESLARPGGNVTGTSFLGPELVAKRLQLIRDVVPQPARVAVLWHPDAYGERTMTGMLKETERAAETLRLPLQMVAANGPDELPAAFAAMSKERASALCLFPSPMLFAQYPRIAEHAAAARLPAIFAAREGADVGGLMSYGANLPDLARQTAVYVERILKGAKPAELPVQQPIKFELIVNLKAARALGLTLTRDFLLLCDEVIE